MRQRHYLAATLSVSVSDLLEDSSYGPLQKRIEQTVPKTLWTYENGETATLQAATSGATMFELWSWTLKPGDRHDSEAHRHGTAELIAISIEQLEIKIGQDVIRYLPGQAARLRTDQAHSYLAIGPNSARLAMAVLEFEPEV